MPATVDHDPAVSADGPSCAVPGRSSFGYLGEVEVGLDPERA
ncbi:MAG: hypothetical protein ACYCU7_06815 [Acidimicrobiales bacterium]